MKAPFFKLIFIVAGCLGAALLLSGCGKSQSAQQKAEQSAIDRHNRDLQEQKAEWQQIQKLRNQPWEKLPAGPPTEEAIHFLVAKLEDKKLPDIDDAIHVLQFNINPFATNYPMSRTFSLQMTNGGFANHYTVVKQSADDTWKLQRAWRTDARGNLVKTYSVDNL